MDDPRGRIVCEIASLACVGGSIVQALPPLSAFLAICWYVVMFYDWLRRRDRH